MKKATIKDVAAMAGVSVATVSYILNEREDQKISEQTRKKVIQIANLLNYSPNLSAQSLSGSKNMMVAVRCSAPSGFAGMDQPYFLNGLSQALAARKYNLVHMPSDALEPVNQVAAIICYNLNKSEFLAVGEANLCPLIAADAVIDHIFFYQVNPDFAALKSEADAYFSGERYRTVALPSQNETFDRRLSDVFPDAAVLSSPDGLSRLGCENLLIFQPSLLPLLKGKNVLFKNCHCESKYAALTDAMEKALSREENLSHDIKYAL